MVYLIAGKLMYVLVYSVLFKIIINFDSLTIFDKFFGWFLIEHVFEYYNQTAGKFFMINEDFRRLIKNSFIILRNIVFWAQFLTLIEFFILIFLPVFLTYNIFLFLKFNKNHKVKNIIYFYYYIFFILILTVKLYFIFTLVDLYIIIQPVIFIFFFLIFCNFIYFYIFSFISFFYKDLKNTKKNKYLFIKIFLYFFIFVILLYFFFKYIIFINKYNNNFIQEFLIQVLLIYIYCYYNI